MRCKITIGDRTIPLEWRGGTAIQYKMIFKRDPIADLMTLIDFASIQDGEPTPEALMGLDTEVVYRIFWTSARTADPEGVNEDFYEFLDEFDALPLYDLLESDMLDMLVSSMLSTKTPKNTKAPPEETS